MGRKALCGQVCNDSNEFPIRALTPSLLDGCNTHLCVCVCVCVCVFVGGYGGCEEKVTEHENVALLRTATLATYAGAVVVVAAGGLMSTLEVSNDLTTTVND